MRNTFSFAPPLEFSMGIKHTNTWKFQGGLKISRTWKYPGPMEISRSPGNFQGGPLFHFGQSVLKTRDSKKDIPVLVKNDIVIQIYRDSKFKKIRQITSFLLNISVQNKGRNPRHDICKKNYTSTF